MRGASTAALAAGREAYRFTSTAGPVTLEDLFVGRGQLAVYHFMLAPDDDHICDGCASMTSVSTPSAPRPTRPSKWRSRPFDSRSFVIRTKFHSAWDEGACDHDL
ncbi:MAG: DUF899 family protein [Alphaproteobacteria bacterium]